MVGVVFISAIVFIALVLLGALLFNYGYFQLSDSAKYFIVDLFEVLTKFCILIAALFLYRYAISVNQRTNKKFANFYRDRWLISSFGLFVFHLIGKSLRRSLKKDKQFLENWCLENMEMSTKDSSHDGMFM